MILPGLFPAQVRSVPTLRGTYVNNNARVSSSRLQISKSVVPANVGDLVVVFVYPEGSSRGDTTTNWGFIQPYTGESTLSYSGYKFWDGTEPTTLQWDLTSGSLTIAPLVLHVFTGVSRFVGQTNSSTSSTSVGPVTSPARLWFASTHSSAGTGGGSPPSGYSGYLEANTLAGDNGGVRSAYRIADELTQATGSWSSVPAQAYRRSIAFR